VEDPVEYVHVSKKSLVSHREVGVDTHRGTTR
jgi:twitching motility protein PilU